MTLIENIDDLVSKLEKVPLDEINTICVDLANDVMLDKIKLTKIVELLGPMLTNTDVKTRMKGVTILSEIMADLKCDFLSEQELVFVCAFFCDRMKDHHSIISPVLHAINAMVGMKNLPSDAPITICTSLFQNIHCQTLTQPERNAVFRFFRTLIFDRIEGLKSMGPDFVLGLLTAIDQERDPQNLMLVFCMLPKFFSSFKLMNLAEEAFNIIACYFPIDFNSENDSSQIFSREDLANALAPCLVAMPEFAEFCVPLILEKLDSDLTVAKLDSLHLLEESFKFWPAESYESNLNDIWSALKKELLPGNNNVTIKQSASEALRQFICKLDQLNEEKRHTVFAGFVEDIISSTSGLLLDVSLSLFAPAVNVLAIVSEASAFVCRKIIKSVVTKLYAVRQNSPADMVVIINSLNLFLKVDLKHSPDSLDQVWTPLGDMLISATANCDREVQAAAFTGLATLTPFLDHSKRKQAIENAAKILADNDIDRTKDACIQCLKFFAVIYPSDTMVDMVESKLLIDKGLSLSEKKWRIETLCQFLFMCKFTEPISIILLDLLEEHSPCTQIVLHSIRSLLENSDIKDDPSVILLSNTFIDRIVRWWIGQPSQITDNKNKLSIFKKEDGSGDYIFDYETISADVSTILETLIRALDQNTQTDIVSSLMPIVAPKNEDGSFSFPLLCSNIHLLEGLLSSIRRNVPLTDWLSLCIALSSIAFNSANVSAQLSACRVLASLLNKQEDEKILAKALGNLAKNVDEHIKEKNMEEKCVRLISWIAKALACRGHSLMVYWLDKLTDLLSNSRVGKYAAQGFHLIMSEDKIHLTAKSQCVVRILYRQRLFQRITMLVASSRTCLVSCKANYLLTIAHFVQAVPTVVLLPYLNQVILPMIESLDYDDNTLELTTLTTLSGLLQAKEPVLESYMDTFIPRFLNLAKQSPYINVRIVSLECLRNYAGYSSILLMPYVQSVIFELESCLDDKKRLVRKAAVNARSIWFSIGALDD